MEDSCDAAPHALQVKGCALRITCYPDRNKTCPRILHSPLSLRQVDCSPGLSSPPGRSRPQKTLRHVTNELKVALAGHAAIWARHSPQTRASGSARPPTSAGQLA